MRNDIVELDDEPRDPPGHRLDRAVIAGLLTASAVFATGVWLARPAVDSRVSSDPAPAATNAPSPAAPARPEGRRDLPVFIRPTLPPGASIPLFIVFGGGGTYPDDVPLATPPDGIRWQAVPNLPQAWRTP